MDKKITIRKFKCEHCEECFTTKQNLQRHISRKHKDIDLSQTTVHDDNVSVLSTDTTIVSVNYQSDNDSPEPDPIPSDEYLINLINEYEKYKHLFPSLHKKLNWEKNNIDVDLSYHEKKHNHKMVYILTDIRDFKV